MSVNYKWIFVIFVHRHQHVVAGPANHNWGLLAQAQTRVIAVQSPGHIWRANTFNVVQTGGCIFFLVGTIVASQDRVQRQPGHPHREPGVF